MIYKKKSLVKLAANIALGLTSFVFGPSYAQHSVIGAVYPIIEENELEAIKREAAKVDWQAVLKNKKNSWMQNQMTFLPNAKEDSVRFHKPIHILEREVTDKNGNIIYPEGFEFNPLNHMRLPYRIIVVSFQQLPWLQPKIKKTDRILLTQGDVFKAREILGQTVFLLDSKTQIKLNVHHVPSIINQKGNMFEIEEFKFDETEMELIKSE